VTGAGTYPSWRRRPGARPLALAALLVLCAAPRPASAGTYETRAYLDLDASVLQHQAGVLTLRLRPMGRAELRFRDEGLVYLKSFLGLRLDLTRWLMLQAYYAHKDLLYPDRARSNAHMAVLDPIFKVRRGPLRLLDRNGLEWHVTDAFFRYRNYLEARVTPGPAWLALFCGGELRVDSDQARVNMLDLRAGLELRPLAHLSVRPFYYLEAKRRGAPDWGLTHIFGMMLSMRLDNGIQDHLLRPQRLDRFQPGGAEGRVDAEKDSQ